MARKPVLGAKAVGSFVPRLTRSAFEKFGFAAATLITDWAQIVGADLARATKPERIKWPKGPAARTDGGEPDTGRPGATLILRVDDGRALDIQYKTAQIIGRINSYFGYRAIEDIRILQAPIARSSAGAPDRDGATALAQPNRADATESAPPILATIKDESLRASLARIAAGLKARAAGSKLG